MPQSLYSENTVSKIFNSMSFGDYEVPVDKAKKWMNEYESSFADKLKNVNQKSVCGTWVTISKTERETFLQSFLHVLQKHQEVLIQILVLQKYTYLVSKGIVDLMIQQFDYYIFSSLLSPNDINVQYQVELDFELLGIRLIFNPMGCILISGSCPVVNIEKSDPHLPFFVYLGEIFKEAKFPENTYSVQLVNKEVSLFSSLQSNIFQIERSYSPWLILEDADLESSAKTLVNALCEYKEKAPWTPSHIYIQESVFENFLDSLKTCFGQVKCGSRFNMTTEVEEEPPASSEFFTNNNLPTIKPLEGCNLILGVGWSLEDIDKDSKINNFVSLVPFRTLNEAVSLVQKISPLDVLNIWSERVSSINQLTSQLSFSTLWVNCFLEIDPKVPFYYGFPCFKESINFICKSKSAVLSVSSQELLSKENSYNIVLNKPLEHFKAIISDSILDAVKKAKEGYLGWQKVSDKNKMLKFLKFMSNFHDKVNLGLCCPFDEIVRVSLLEPEKKSCNTVVRNLNVGYQVVPFGLIVIHLDHYYHGIGEHLNTILISLMAFGNSVIIAAGNVVTFKLAVQCVSVISSSNIFQKNLLTVLQMYNASPKDCLKKLKENNLISSVRRIISLGFVVNLDDPREITCDSFIIHIPPSLSFDFSTDFLTFVSSSYKCIWTPAK